jgi:hypothetical protein
MRFRSHRGPRALTRAVAAALTAFALVAQLASFAHLGAVQHYRCEHGELVEMDDDPGVGHHDPEQAFHPSDDDDDDHDHDHCVLGPSRRDRLTPRCNIPLQQPPLAIAAPLLPPAATTVMAPIRLLLLAPKSSPPA